MRFQGQKWEYIRKQKEQILVISVNVIETDLEKKYSYIICYNYNKKSYYLKFYLKSLKN